MLTLQELQNLSVKMAEGEEPGMLSKGVSKVKELAGKGYDKTVDALKSDTAKTMYGGGAVGALAGIPIGLLVQALRGDSKSKSLRDYLKSGLMGALIGGGAGALGAGGIRGISMTDMGKDFGAKIRGEGNEDLGKRNHLEGEEMWGVGHIEQFLQALRHGMGGGTVNLFKD